MSVEPDIGRPPVMVDVARLAGVSHQTVSRVLFHLQQHRTGIWVCSAFRHSISCQSQCLGETSSGVAASTYRR